ncbi:hypothetical protein [Brucella sp. IR073]|uniref:hypothetical protein n=1 Tax=unclassified Brucella TaxID=2632610 RepID=UPI003B97EF8F
MMQSIALPPDCVLPPDGIIPAEMVNSLLSKHRSAKSARRRIHRYMERIRAVCKAEEEAARQRGYAEGVRTFLAALDDMRQEYRQHFQQTAGLVRKCLEQILLEMPSEAWLDATIISVLRSVRDEPELSVMVHPDNLAAIENTIAKRKNEHPSLSYLRIELDPALTSQDCIFYAGADVIDVSVPVILDDLCLALSQGEKQ